MDELLNLEACTLPSAERPFRLAAFDDLFRHVVRVEAGETSARIHLTGPAGLASRAQELVDLESRCCSFFGFVVTGSDEAVELDVTVPGERADVLAGLVERAARGLEGPR